jgi:hypothetical protein
MTVPTYTNRALGPSLPAAVTARRTAATIKVSVLSYFVTYT